MEKAGGVEPKFEGLPKPKVIEILKLLPKTNCRESGQATCMVLAAKIAEGEKGPEDCPPLRKELIMKIQDYMAAFQLDI